MALRTLDWKEGLRLRLVEVLVAAAILFIAARIAAPRTSGEEVLAREATVLEVLQEIHAAQLAAHEDGTVSRWLPGIVRDAAVGSRLAEVVAVPNERVDLVEVGEYLVALYLVDPAYADDRAWTEGAGGAEAGRRGYGAFAWPKRYATDSQWAFFVDHRGKLLGSWNHAGLFDGVNEPFPPNAHPLRDYLSGKQEGEDAEWVLFSDCGEIVVGAPEGEQG